MRKTNFAARIGRWSAQHRKTAILGWLAFVLVSLVDRDEPPPAEGDRPGQPGCPASPARPPRRIDGAFPDKSVRAGADPEQAAQRRRLPSSRPRSPTSPSASSDTKGVDNVVGPYDGAARPDLGRRAFGARHLRAPGRLGQSTEKSVVGSLAAVAAAQKAHPELRIEEMGDESLTKAIAREVERGDGQVDADLAAAHADHPGVRVRSAGGGRYPAAARAHQRGARRWVCSARSARSRRSMDRSCTSSCSSAWPSVSTTASSI